jgi:penicillin-insensitive murein DD-endopeptidase
MNAKPRPSSTPTLTPSSFTFVALVLVTLVWQSTWAQTQPSVCYGTVSNGRIEGGVRLPLGGRNFSSYSTLAAISGRTHVHTTVSEIVVDAYKALEAASPGSYFVYGETGWPRGGRFRPHRTHQNGLSVDFFVPVRNGKADSVPLPTTVAIRFGYDIEFDQTGKYGEYKIDFVAMAEHLAQLHLSAKAKGVGIALVIFDTTFLPKLLATPQGPYLKQHMLFMKSTPCVRHDEHFHVDFSLPCKPLAK